MCLILFEWRQHAEYPLILIANRDEYYDRPTRDAHWWEDAEIFGGRDLEAGGTWLGLDRRGRLAAVTNVREAGSMQAGMRSRGDLTREYLTGSDSATAYLDRLESRKMEYAGFNLLLGDLDQLFFYSNRGNGIHRIEPGTYGVSNGKFDEPWPKLESGKRELAALSSESIDAAGLMNILVDHSIAEDQELPSTGVSLEVERMLSSRFIRSTEYGTRACSVLLFDSQNQIHFTEQNFIDAERTGERVNVTIQRNPG